MKVQGHLWLHSEFKATLGHMIACFNLSSSRPFIIRNPILRSALHVSLQTLLKGIHTLYKS